MTRMTWIKAGVVCAVWTFALTLVPLLKGADAGSSRVVAGVLIAMTGRPLLQVPGSESWDKLKLNQFIYEGDTLRTSSGEKAAVALVGGAEVRINERSVFVMESGGGRKAASLSTKAGQAWTRLLHGRSTVQVRSALAVCSVRGTEADVDVGDRMTVKVYEGLVDVFNDQGRQSLTAGQMTQVAGPGAAPQAPKTLAPGDVGDWQNGLKAVDVEKNIQRLNKEAVRTRALELELNKDGQKKKIQLKFEKK